MITPLMWRGLTEAPVNHPLFRRENRVQVVARHWPVLWLILGVGVAIVFLCSTIVSALRWTSAALPLLPLTLPLLVNARAFSWALDVADAVGSEREHETWDLLRLLPDGGLASGWTMACACMYRHEAFEFVGGLARAVLAVGGTVVTVITAVSLISTESYRLYHLTADQLPGEFMLTSAATIALLYVDFLQTVALSAAVGLYAGSQARTREDARALAATSFAVIQLAVYFLLGIVGLSILPDLFDHLGWTGLLPLIGLLLFRFVLLCGTREIVLIALWRRLTDQLGAMPLTPTAP